MFFLIASPFFSLFIKIKKKLSKAKPLETRLRIQNEIFLKEYNFEVDPNIIFFESYKVKFTCSPKAIYNEMKEREEFKDHIFIWAISPELDKESLRVLRKNNNTILVEYGSSQYEEYISKASLIFTNSRLHRLFYKKEKQIVVQTWHGTPFKKDALSVNLSTHHQTSSERVLINKHDVQNYSYLLTQNKFSSIELGKTFDLDNFKEVKILESGYPRNDSLFNVSEEEIEELRTKFYYTHGIPKDKKIILYAPTWRDHHKTNTKNINDGFQFDELKEALAEDYHIIFRGHQFHSKTLNLDKVEGFTTDLSNYTEINDLYLISDILITDYSSVFFDYANLNKPILFNMFDYHAYTNLSRKLHLDIYNDLPGPVSFKASDLIENIKNIEKINILYKEKYHVFKEKFNSLDNGNNSSKVIDILIKELSLA